MVKPTIRELEEILDGPDGGMVQVNADGSVSLIPQDIVDHMLKLGRAEWGSTPEHDADGHADHIRQSVRITAEHFGQTEPQKMHGLYLEGTETVVCHTGTSPNSPTSARALTAAWNHLHDACVQQQKRSASAQADENTEERGNG